MDTWSHDVATVTYRIEQARDAIEPDDYAAMLAEAIETDVYANGTTS